MRRAFLALAALALTAAAPADYELRLALTPAPNAAVQRVELPPAVLARSRSGALADVAVFDAKGRALPIARARAAPAAERRVSAAALPILGGADALRVTGVSLRLDGDGRARVARVDGSVDGPTGTVLLGALFDFRRTTGAARALTLEADAPASQPITFSVAASRDLKDWRPLGEAVLFRGEGAPARVAVPLDGAALEREWLRVTWRADARLLSPVAVRSATLTLADPAATPATLDLAAPKPADPKAFELALPFAAPLASVALLPGPGDLLTPFRLLGRDAPEQPWTPIGDGVARAGSPVAVALNGRAWKQLRVEADSRGAGFTAAPTVRLGFAPAALLFATSGAPPYTLAIGRERATDPWLPAAALGAPAAPLRATLAAAPAVPALQAPADAGLRGRRALLWGALLLATACLAALAFALWRRDASA